MFCAQTFFELLIFFILNCNMFVFFLNKFNSLCCNDANANFYLEKLCIYRIELLCSYLPGCLFTLIFKHLGKLNMELAVLFSSWWILRKIINDHFVVFPFVLFYKKKPKALKLWIKCKPLLFFNFNRSKGIIDLALEYNNFKLWHYLFINCGFILAKNT